MWYPKMSVVLHMVTLQYAAGQQGGGEQMPVRACTCGSGTAARAGRRQQDRPRRAALGRRPAARGHHADRGEDDRRPVRRRHDPRARPALDPDGGFADRRRAEYSRLAARLLDCYIAKEVMNQDIHSFSQAIATGHAAWPDRRRDGPVRRGRRPQAERGRATIAATCSSTSACARSTTATCSATRPRATSSRPRSTSSCGSPAGCRAP